MKLSSLIPTTSLILTGWSLSQIESLHDAATEVDKIVADTNFEIPLDTDTLMPGKEHKGKITGSDQWMAIQNDQAIFITHGKNNYEALYLYDLNTKKLYFIIDNETPILDKNASRFEISNAPIINNRLAFMTRFQDNTSGIYLTTLPGLTVEPSREKN